MKNLFTIDSVHFEKDLIMFQINGGHAVYFIKNEMLNEFNSEDIAFQMILDENWICIIQTNDNLKNNFKKQ